MGAEAQGCRMLSLPLLLIVMFPAGWQIYTRTDPHYRYSVEYPTAWSVEESGNTSFFMPPSATSRRESIAIVAIDYRKTPPPPVHRTYTTVRTVVASGSRILVRTRSPSPVTERYFAEIQKGDYTMEFRFSLDHQHDGVFDHMLATFQ
jgi:hypothetical protein